MPEQLPSEAPDYIPDKHLSVGQFLSIVQKEIDDKFKKRYYWITGEISDLKNKKHYYGELIDTSYAMGKSHPRIKFMIWQSRASAILPTFEKITGETLKTGMKVLFQVELSYHVCFGLGLVIHNIDPSFTLGEIERRKLQILDTLTNEGLLNQNKKLPLPFDYTRVAVISSENAAGLQDFNREAFNLQKLNLCTFDFYQASMQGNNCEPELVGTLRELFRDIRSKEISYDAIIIIRGGGSSSDLDSFNRYAIGKAIAFMQVPVFIGIGHDKDNVVPDHVARMSFGTPSKVIKHIEETIISNAMAARDFKNKIVKQSKYIIMNKTQECKNLQKTISNRGSYLINISKYHCTEKLNQLIVRSKNTVQLCRTNTNNTFSNIQQQSNSFFKYFKREQIKKYNEILRRSPLVLKIHKEQLEQTSKNLMFRSSQTISNNEKELLNILHKFSNQLKYLLKNNSSNIVNMYKHVLAVSIEPTLKRGFTLLKSTKNNYITSADEARKHSNFTIKFHDGEIKGNRDND